MSEQREAEHFGGEIRESAEAKAERVLSEALEKANWSEAELKSARKGDARKVKIALRLRRDTTMTLAWIAERLSMGTLTHLSHLLYWHDKKKPT
jgi:hypothetical protein